MTKGKSASLIAAFLLGFVFIGFLAGFFSGSFWYAHWEPVIYPCLYSDSGGLCEYDPNIPAPLPEPAILYFS